MTFPSFLLVFFFRVAPSASVSWEHEIFVEKNGTNSSESCGSMHTPCATFNKALQRLTQNSTVIYVGPGTYTLEHGIETTISGLNKLAIIGRSKDSTIINCSPSTGLVFEVSSNITIESISFQYCGEYNSYLLGFRAAVSFLLSGNVRMSHVAIQFSNGTGLFVECVQEAMIIEYCVIRDSRVNVIPDTYGMSLIGGGIILFEDCVPRTANSYLIHESIIDSNEFQYYTQPYYDKLQLCPEDLGGGITIMFLMSISHVVVDSSVITNNTKGLSMIGITYGSVQIINSSIYSNVHSSEAIILSNTFHSLLYFFDVNMTETMMLAFQPKVNVTVGNYQNEITVKSGFFQFSVHFSNTKNYTQIPIQLIQKECTTDNVIALDSLVVWGLWFDKVTGSLLHCPVPYAYCNKNGCSCTFTRRGRLCGQCKDGYSVAINSNYLVCVQCNKPETVVKGWALLIALEFIPITVMVILIAMLNVNLNQGSLNAYIFFCQIMTVSFPSVGYPAWLLTHEYPQTYSIYLLPLSIWNLNFINIPSVSESFSDEVDYYKFSIHISQSTSPLEAISFWFLIAFYPFVLLILIYICTILYGRGYKCIVYFVRPFHRILARFRSMFNIQPSLTHTAASVFTLCFVQLAATSFKILHPAWYEDKHGKYHSVFFYDGTQPYFRNWHGLAGTFAVMVLMFLSIVTLYLLIYPFQWFQKCLNKVKFRKDFLISVTDAFTGPYKNGTENSWDYRFFAGVHFALRLIIMVFYYVPQDRSIIRHNYMYMYIIAGLEATLCFLTATAIIIFRPYKRNIHSFNNMFLLLVLGAFGLYPFYEISISLWHNDTYFKFLILPICGSVVLVVVTPYCVLWLIKKVKAGIAHLISIQDQHYNNNNNRRNTELQNQVDNEGLLHAHNQSRLVRPELYEERHVRVRQDSENDALIAVTNKSFNYETLNN